jgi:hypothetical protein
LYAYVLQDLPLMNFQDRISYINYANFSDVLLLNYWNRGILQFFSNEPLWLCINIVLKYFLDAENVVRFIIFSSSLIFSYKILSINKESLLIAIFLLLMPVVLKNFITHLRQGLAISLFILFYFSNSNQKKLSFLIPPFVHSSFFFLSLLYYSAFLLKKYRQGIDVRLLYYFFSMLFIVFALEYISYWFGARQAYAYGFESSSGSGLGFIFWFFIFILLVSEGYEYFIENEFVLTIVALYLMSYFFLEVTARIFESGIILVFLAGLRLNRTRKFLFLASMIFYMSMTWYGRFHSEFMF